VELADRYCRNNYLWLLTMDTIVEPCVLAMSLRSLGDVPEEDTTLHPNASLSVPSSTSRAPGISRKTPSIRTLGRSSTDASTVKKNPSASSTATKEPRTPKAASTSTLKKARSTPRLPHDTEAEAAPSTSMYWSRAPVYGTIPPKFMRGHSVTLVEAIAWIFGGCDDKDLKENVRDMRIIYCFDTGTISPIVPRSSHLTTFGRNYAMVATRHSR
jgi:Rab9 effector protein with kelch motifs